MKQFYQIEWNRFVTLLLPPLFRQPRLLALLRVLMLPFEKIHTRFLNFCQYTQRRLTVTPQVCRLQGLLNDFFDPDNRQITIVDGQRNQFLILYPGSLFNQTYRRWPTWLNQPYQITQVNGNRTLLFNTPLPTLPTISNAGTLGNDFVVQIPAALGNIDITRLHAVIQSNKLASKIYTIKTV